MILNSLSFIDVTNSSFRTLSLTLHSIISLREEDILLILSRCFWFSIVNSLSIDTIRRSKNLITLTNSLIMEIREYFEKVMQDFNRML